MTTYTRYGHVGAHLAAGDIDYTGGTVKAMLLDNTYVFDQDAHEFVDDVSTAEASGTGYTAGGQALAGKSTSYDATANQTALLASDTVWDATGGALTGAFVAVYLDTGTPATSPLIALVDFEGDVTATNAALTVDWNDTGGVLKL